MAIGTYSELQTAVASWLNRVDQTTNITNCIALAEAQFNRTIRHRQMEMRSTATATEYMEFPDYYLEMRRVHLTGTPRVELKVLTPQEANSSEYSSSTGEPAGYVLLANQIQIVPAPDGTYTVEIDYYRTIPALSGSNTTNWLLSAYPDLYLTATLVYITSAIQDYDAMERFKADYRVLLNDVNNYERKQKHSGTPLFTRPG